MPGLGFLPTIPSARVNGSGPFGRLMAGISFPMAVFPCFPIVTACIFVSSTRIFAQTAAPPPDWLVDPVTLQGADRGEGWQR